MLRTAVGTDSYRTQTEDRVEVRDLGGRVMIALADGAGGISGGAAAAEFALRGILEYPPSEQPAEWYKCLAGINRQLLDRGGGETIAVAVLMTPELIVGCSVGDSGAWFIGEAGVVDLSGQPKRKAMLGRDFSSFLPTGFAMGAGKGTLCVATDGLLKYAPREVIIETIRKARLEDAPRMLIDLARMKSGGLQDDVAVALCRRD